MDDQDELILSDLLCDIHDSLFAFKEKRRRSLDTIHDSRHITRSKAKGCLRLDLIVESTVTI